MFRILPFQFRNNVEKGRESVERWMEYLLEHPVNPLGKVSGVLSSFRVDVLDAGDCYELLAELPGFSKQEIHLSYEDGKYLTLRAEHACTEEEAMVEHRYICHERRDGVLERSFLVDDIEEGKITAVFQDGILKVTLPKYQEEKEKTFIEIR